MPLVRISLAMKNMSSGDRLRVQACDPAFAVNLDAWVTRLGYRLVEYRNGPVSEAVIEKR